MKLTTPAKDAKSKEKIEPHKAKPLASAAAGKPMVNLVIFLCYKSYKSNCMCVANAFSLPYGVI